MTDIRARLAEALAAELEIRHGTVQTWGAHIADVLLSLSGIAIIEIPAVAYKGPHDTDASAFRAAAKRLDTGYEPGGSNTKRAISQILGAVADAAERQGKPESASPDYAGCSGACADLGDDQ